MHVSRARWEKLNISGGRRMFRENSFKNCVTGIAILILIFEILLPESGEGGIKNDGKLSQETYR